MMMMKIEWSYTSTSFIRLRSLDRENFGAKNEDLVYSMAEARNHALYVSTDSEKVLRLLF
jgi:hypothetical protein